MAIYYYKARDKMGQAVQGSREGSSTLQVAAGLQEEGYFLTAISAKQPLSLSLKGSWKLPEAPVRQNDLALFCRQLAVMQEAGIPLLTSLQQLAEQTPQKRLRKAIKEIIKDISAGMTFSEAATRQGNAFGPIFINMIAAGEMGGVLDEVLIRLAEHFEREGQIREKIKTAMAYPIAIGCVAILAVIVLLTVVLPRFVSVLTGMGVELPLPTRIVIGISDFLVHYWYLLLLGVALLTMLFKAWASTPGGKRNIDEFKLKVPGFGKFTKNIILGRFTRILGTLLKTGVQIMPALEIVSKIVANESVAQEIQLCRQAVTDGKSLASPLIGSRIFPPMVVQMMQVGEETGNIDTLLLKVSVFYEREVDEMAERLSKMIEPILLVFLGGFIGSIIYAIMAPMFSIYSNM